jgi:hypothetical protein
VLQNQNVTVPLRAPAGDQAVTVEVDGWPGEPSPETNSVRIGTLSRVVAADLPPEPDAQVIDAQIIDADVPIFPDFEVFDARLVPDASDGAVVVRVDGTVVPAADVRAALALADARGFGAVSGDRVVLAGVSNSDGEGALVTGRLFEGVAGFSLAEVERTALSGITQVASVVLHHGRAYVATSPFGLLSVDEDGGAVATEIAADNGGDLADVAFVDDDGSERVLVAGEREVGGE